MNPRYPVYVISKGRAGTPLTARFLLRDEVPFKLVIEPQERDAYAAALPEADLLVTPFSNLGQGGIPVRNFVWDHALASGHARHWILDDNIHYVMRRYKAQRVYVHSGIAMAVMEQFVDRYENIAIAGPNYAMFAPDRLKLPPFHLNAHVYSFLLIKNDLPNRWRGRYNEDTDLCLQVLADGWCTVQMNAFVADKMWTMQMKGGNTDDLYKDDGRLKMARSLERQWPGVVTTIRRYQRPQHNVKDQWKRFDTPLKRRTDIDWNALPPVDEHGMVLKARAEPQGEDTKALWMEHNVKRE